MSVEMLEPEPSPSDTDNERLKQAYIQFFEGMIFDDIEGITSAINTLESSGLPGSGCLSERSYKHITHILNGETNLNLGRDIYFGDRVQAVIEGIRSYAYSGLEIDADIIHLIAAYCGISKRELYWWIKPNYSNVGQVVDDVHDPEMYYQYAAKGEESLLKLMPVWRRVLRQIFITEVPSDRRQANVFYR